VLPGCPTASHPSTTAQSVSWSWLRPFQAGSSGSGPWVQRPVGHSLQGAMLRAAAQEPGGQRARVSPTQPQPRRLPHASWEVHWALPLLRHSGVPAGGCRGLDTEEGLPVVVPGGQDLQGEAFRPKMGSSEP
jgi:hypothetical protein